MNDERENEPHFDLRVPERFRDLIVPLLESLKRAHREVASAAPGGVQARTDAETIEFAGELLTFALHKYGRGRLRSVPHCIAVHVFFQATRGHEGVAQAIIDAATANSEVADRFAAFFGDLGLPSGSWQENLRRLVETGQLKALGNAAQNRISVADVKHDFVPAFEKYLKRRRDLNERQRERYARWLRSLLLPLPAHELQTEAHSGDTPAVLGGSPASRPVFIGLAAAGIALTAAFSVRRCGSGEDAQGPRSATHLSQATSTRTDPRSATQGGTGSICERLPAGFETKACLIAEADGARASYARSAALYRQAIAYDYDPAGIFGQGDAAAKYQNLSQTLDAYDGLASLESVHGHDKEALAAFRERFRRREEVVDPLDWTLLLQSTDCTILVALERRANGAQAALTANTDCRTKAPFPNSGFDISLLAFELGKSYVDLGRASDALEVYGAVLGWRMEEPDGTYSTVWPGSRWRHLVADLPASIVGARARFEAALQLMPKGRALVVGNIAVWTRPTGEDGHMVLGLLPLSLPAPEVCLVDDPVNSDPLLVTKTWNVSVAMQPEIVATHGVAVLPRGRPAAPFPWYGSLDRREQPFLLRAHVGVRLAKPNALPAGCLDQDLEVRICVFPDGRLGEAAACE